MYMHSYIGSGWKTKESSSGEGESPKKISSKGGKPKLAKMVG